MRILAAINFNWDQVPWLGVILGVGLGNFLYLITNSDNPVQKGKALWGVVTTIACLVVGTLVAMIS